MITKEIVDKYFDYDENTGDLTRRFIEENTKCDRMYNSRFAGKVVAGKDGKGYLVARCLGKTYRVARLIYLKKTGKLPDQVDHKNRIRDDNRWCNLRDVDNQINCWNRGKYNKGNTTSNYEGVSLHRKSGKWRAQIAVNGKKKHIGLFDDEEVAHEEYLRIKKELCKK